MIQVIKLVKKIKIFYSFSFYEEEKELGVNVMDW